MFILRLVLIIPFFLALGCKKPLENPESVDPIYADLLKLEKEHMAQYKSKIMELDVIKKDWETADVLSGRKKTAKAKYFSKEREAEKEQQLSRYYGLRAKTRKQEARKAYMLFFNQDKPWPPPEEYEGFLAENRLRNASKTWDSRVPRWNQRLKSSAPTEEPKKKGSSKSEKPPPTH